MKKLKKKKYAKEDEYSDSSDVEGEKEKEPVPTTPEAKKQKIKKLRKSIAAMQKRVETAKARNANYTNVLQLTHNVDTKELQNSLISTDSKLIKELEETKRLVGELYDKLNKNTKLVSIIKKKKRPQAEIIDSEQIDANEVVELYFQKS